MEIKTKEQFTLESTYSKVFEIKSDKKYKVCLEMDCHRGILECDEFSNSPYPGYIKVTNSMRPSVLFTYRMAVTSDMNQTAGELSKKLLPVTYSDIYMEEEKGNFTFENFIDRMQVFVITNPDYFVSKYLV